MRIPLVNALSTRNDGIESKLSVVGRAALNTASAASVATGGGGIFVTMNRNYGGLDTKSSAGTAFMLAAMIVPTAIISHILIDGNASNLLDEATLIGALVPILVMFLAFTGAKYAIKYLPVKIITTLFIIIISISMLKYIQEITAIIL